MSPQSRSRKKPTSQRSPRTRAVAGLGLALPGLEELYAAFLHASEELVALAGPLQAELWTSTQLGVLERAAPDSGAHRRALGDLVGYLRRSETPGAHVFLRAFAAIGPQELRADAAKAADGTAGRPGGSVPAWVPALGRVLPGETWLIQDGSLGGDQIVCEFRYVDGGGPLHALLVQVTQGRATQLLAIGDVPGMMAQVRQGVAAEECAVLRLDPAAAGARLRAALGGDPDPHPEEYHAALAFARHRIEALP
ncbi:MAG: hypothetical protein JWN52_6417 [Actinomycetia bacterium]|nr:hypothetical protein [Actinomycetes bacterium]